MRDAEVTAGVNSTAATGTRQFATFVVDRLLFGVDVQQVQEVIKYQEMTPVPLSSSTIKGLINLRGQIIVAIDLRIRLGLPRTEENRRPMNVVVRCGEEVVSLLVDQIGDVLELQAEQWERTPGGIGVSRDLISGVFKLDSQLMLELDVEEALKIRNDN